MHHPELSIISLSGALLALYPSIQTICRPAVKLKSEKHSSLLKKALATTLIVAVPGGMLIGLAYLLAKKKPKLAAGEPPKGE